MRQAQKTLGKDYKGPEATGIVVPPEGGEFVWEEFWRLRRGAPLSFSEIEAYCRLTGTRFARWEVEALRQMDVECINWRAGGGHIEPGNTDRLKSSSDGKPAT